MNEPTTRRRRSPRAWLLFATAVLAVLALTAWLAAPQAPVEADVTISGGIFSSSSCTEYDCIAPGSCSWPTSCGQPSPTSIAHPVGLFLDCSQECTDRFDCQPVPGCFTGCDTDLGYCRYECRNLAIVCNPQPF